MTSRNGTAKTLRFVIMALGCMAMTREASAIERKGFIIGLGVGGGKATCKECESRSGGGVEIHLGAMLTKRLALVLDSSGVSSEDVDGRGVTVTSTVTGPALQYWVSPRVWVKAGVGGGSIYASGNGVDSTSDGLGFLGGIGVEAIQKQRFAIDLQLRFTTASIEGSRHNNFFAAVGFNFY